ncbi:MAG TPA: hypothetical protein DC046_04370 [Rhodospirillaceae bacterium]|nr:hypothetical protein [Rhodospirillaceae bacterium]
MWFLMRQVMRYGRYVAWTVAAAAAAGLYGILSVRKEITLFGGEAHVIEWWEPYVWPPVAFVIVSRVLRMVLNRFAGAANAHMARLRRGDIFGPRP